MFDEQGRVLLLQHRNGDWVFPKGHLEGSETPLEAALREVHEEAGLLVRCPEPHRSWITSYRNAQGVPRRITWFACYAKNASPHLTEELFRAARFEPPSGALAELTYDVDRELLERILAAGYPRTGGEAP